MLAVKSCKSIAEYAIRRWMCEKGFEGGCFSVKMSGNEGLLKDQNGDTLTPVYDGKEKCVYIKE